MWALRLLGWAGKAVKLPFSLVSKVPFIGKPLAFGAGSYGVYKADQLTGSHVKTYLGNKTRAVGTSFVIKDTALQQQINNTDLTLTQRQAALNQGVDEAYGPVAGFVLKPVAASLLLPTPPKEETSTGSPAPNGNNPAPSPDTDAGKGGGIMDTFGDTAREWGPLAAAFAVGTAIYTWITDRWFWTALGGAAGAYFLAKKLLPNEESPTASSSPPPDPSKPTVVASTAPPAPSGVPTSNLGADFSTGANGAGKPVKNGDQSLSAVYNTGDGTVTPKPKPKKPGFAAVTLTDTQSHHLEPILAAE